MKFLVFLFLVGCASASFYDVLDDAAEEIYHDYMAGIEQASSLGLDDTAFADDVDIKTELGKKLRETLDHLLEKIKEAVDHGKTVREDLQVKLKEIKEKMKDLKIDVGDRAKDLMEKIREKSKEFLKNLLEKLGLNDKRSLQEETVQQALADFNFREIFENLKKTLLSKIDKEKLKEKVEGLFGKGSEMADALLDIINNKGDKYKQKLLDIIDRYLGKERRSLQQARVDFNFREIFENLKKTLLSKVDKEKLKEKVESLFGKGSEMADALLDIINNKGDKYKQKLLDIIDRYLGKEKRSLAEYWEKVKDYFKDLKIDLQEKYLKFGEWVKEVVNKGLDKGKSKVENIREIAREFIDHAKGVSKEVAVEALDFLKPYKEDLGSLYDQVKDTVKDILNRKD